METGLMKFIFCLTVMFVGLECLCAELCLSRSGTANAVIILRKDASQSERYAAEQLAFFLKQATGADFKIRGTPMEQPGIVNLWVGGEAEKTDFLGKDGILIQNRPRGLLLTGKAPRGTLYAVFTFIEDSLGFRFWSGKQIGYRKDLNGKRLPPILISEAEIGKPPVRADLTVEVQDLRYSPQFELREPYWGTNLNDPDWCIRNKVIGRISKTGTEESKYGGHLNILGHIQSFWYWLPPEKYFSNHPEYYSMIDGVRNWKNPKGKLWADRQTQLCMTNPAVAEELANQVIIRLKKATSKVDGVSIAPNDWNNPCQCPPCQKVYEAEGSPSGALLMLINRVAERVHRDFPEVEIHTGAYMWYQKPPKNIRPASKVVVWFVTQGMNLCEKYDTPRNRVIYERLKGWADVCRNQKLYIWDHGANWDHYLVPFPDLGRWQSSMRLYQRLGVKGIWFLGAYSTPNMELATLRNWIMAKLCWNPNLDVDSLLDQFLVEYYQEAAPLIGQYIRNYHEAYRKSQQSFDKWRWSPLADCRFLSADLLLKSNQLIKQAMHVVRDNPVLKQRVMRIQLSLWYLFLLRYDELKSATVAMKKTWPFENGMLDLLTAFNEALTPAGILTFAEGARSFWPSVTERAMLPEKMIPPPGYENYSPAEWTILTPDNFSGPSEAAKRQPDMESAGKKALVLQPQKEEPLFRRAMWNIPLNITARESKRKVRILLQIKATVSGIGGDAFKCGVEFRSNRLTIPVSAIQDNQYHWYDLGEVEKPCDWTHLWIKVSNNPNIDTVSLGAVALILGTNEE